MDHRYSDYQCEWWTWNLWARYGPPDRVRREEFWNILCSLVNSGSKMWACIGDFNEVCDQSEKLGGREANSKNNFFLKFFRDDVNGVDIGFSGNTFTWCNKRGCLANIRERLNRVITSIEWRTKFDNAGVIHLNAQCSDHTPILLNLHLDNPNLPRPFRFQKIWIRDSSCANVVRGAWECNSSCLEKI